MGVEVGIWRLDGGLTRLTSSQLPDESRLEEVLERDISILGLDLMVIGRQVLTGFGKRIDLLGINAEGDLVVIELKRDRTPRDIVAQVLDYGSWIVDLGYEDIIEIYASADGKLPFEEAFSERFGGPLPDALNQTHSLVIVATELDASTERIVGYLSAQYGVPVNAAFFRYFVDDGREYLARSWLIAPDEVESKTWSTGGAHRKEQPWNGQDYYIAFGVGGSRFWEDAQKYGFVSGGGGPWYSRSLKALEPGNRVFVHIPTHGYVGVGTVTRSAVPPRDFVPDGYKETLLDLPLMAPDVGQFQDDPDMAEWVVGVEWIKKLPVSEAVWETGFFANQNTACKMRSQFTIDRLTACFGLDQS